MDLDIIKTYSDVVVFEGDNKYSKDKIVVADGETVALGDVLGKKTSTGEFFPLDTAAADGTEIAAAVATTKKTGSSGTADVMAIVRHAIVTGENLGWPDSISEGDKNIAIDQLKAIGVVVD